MKTDPNLTAITTSYMHQTQILRISFRRDAANLNIEQLIKQNLYTDNKPLIE